MDNAEMMAKANHLLAKGELEAGTTYVVDKTDDDTVWSVVVWASGGVWFVSPHRQGERDYEKYRRWAVLEPSTLFYVGERV